jgi:hypothetical protein
MHQLVAAEGGAYLHVLQPNQYHRTARVFTAPEAAVARSDASPYKSAVERGYPALLHAAASELLPRRVAFLDATMLFDREPSPVYMDNCCHYSHRGNMLLADFIAAAVVDRRIH